jgi:hypothetical protein
MLLDSAGAPSGVNARSNPAMPAIERPNTELSFAVMNGNGHGLGHSRWANDEGGREESAAVDETGAIDECRLLGVDADSSARATPANVDSRNRGTNRRPCRARRNKRTFAGAALKQVCPVRGADFGAGGSAGRVRHSFTDRAAVA